ncbi:hypothetical protein [Blastococcus saxobsidens]|uniref:Uncharacterized protein n=1 Tax=Blastococcus saxobsidens TaxID=138336 RepID=A0A4Q7Y9F1_9ACTN|nr:hypothetical protein [Blastococcus saxobsidens]RZU32699.1 hypothetical protein BKA19_2400 [Blastococcus saxobsidens]
MTSSVCDGVSVKEVDREAVMRNVDRLARRFLKISGAEFLRRKQHGELDSFGDSAKLQRVLSAATLLD